MGWTTATLLKFLCSASAVYVSFILWGVLQEKITAEGYEDGKGSKVVFKEVAVLNLVQALVGALVGFVGLLFVTARPEAPVSAFAVVGLTTTIASPIGYQSLNFIDYPLFALGKSCKMIPVMLWSIVLNKTKYTPSEYLSVAFITAGVGLFSLKSSAGVLGSSLLLTCLGLGIVFINLMVDGYTCAQQDSMTKRSVAPVPSVQSLAYMNVWIVTFLSLFLLSDHFLPPLLASFGSFDWMLLRQSSITRALSFYQRFPQLLTDLLLFSACGSLGQLVILYNIREYGSLVNTIITVTRKFLTIIVSVVVYNHPMSFTKWLGACLVFCGLVLEAYHSYKRKHK